jgi:hypothetical protein
MAMCDEPGRASNGSKRCAPRWSLTIDAAAQVRVQQWGALLPQTRRLVSRIC